MSWDIRDTTPSTPPGSVLDSVPMQEPACPLLVPTLAIVHDLDDWLHDPLLDTLPPHELAAWREQGLVPPSQWGPLRRLMMRGVVEM